MQYGFQLMAFRPTRAIAGEGGACVSVKVNGRQMGPGGMRDEKGRPIYRTILFDQERAHGGTPAADRKPSRKTPCQMWMDGAARRKEEREASMAQLKGILPNEDIEKMRQAQETTEREVTGPHTSGNRS